MKAVIFAGGFGTRLSEATNLIPKPMVEIGGKPILWHIMKTYSHYGINEFIIMDVRVNFNTVIAFTSHETIKAVY